MRVQKFAIDEETPPRLELRWEGPQIHIHLDGANEATIDAISGLKEGWSKQLPDGRTLEVRTIRRRTLFRELSVLVDGEHTESSPSHPDRMLRSSANGMLVLSVFMIVSGFTGTMKGNWLDVVFGTFYLIGALLLRSRRRVGAVLIAIPMFLRLDLLAIAAWTGGISRNWIIELLLNLVFASYVLRSYQAARDSQKLRPILR